MMMMNYFKKNTLLILCCGLILAASCQKGQVKPQEVIDEAIGNQTSKETLANVPQYGTGWVQKTYTYVLHKPYNLDTNARHSYNGTFEEHTFWIYNTDSAFQAGSNTSPRSEMRMKHNSTNPGYDYYTVGNHQFEADMKVDSGSANPIIMQVFGTAVANDKPAFNIKVYPYNGGELRFFDGRVLATNIYGTWVHINVVHATAERKFHVFINGTEVTNGNGKYYFEDKGAGQHYFKCGVYTSQSAISKVKIKHIRYYYKP
ncbi:polysaccharide lyase family 7 protein [Mucilaginibacter terrae]|uniref:polysaccharide lyase family 7 protein n=1 Tax=Mucilaginibacter terrae TaxID=1955052 RepID=UPI00363A64B5